MSKSKSCNMVSFVPSDNQSGTKPAEDPYIMEIDGKRFYALVTGSETALEDLFNVIPNILTSPFPFAS